MAHAAHEDGHDESTGHGAHHVASPQLLLKTIGVLVFLTILTVVLALMERSGWLPLGPLSVPVALLIASVKAYFVAAYFMGLKYDGGTNLLAFGGSAIFLLIFLTFTYLDTGFRDTFEEQSAVPIDEIQVEALEAARESELITPAFEAQPLVNEPDQGLFPNAAEATQDAITVPEEDAASGDAGDSETAPEPTE